MTEGLSDAIRRRRPTVDSPLGELILGRIDKAEYERRRALQRWREMDICGPFDSPENESPLSAYIRAHHSGLHR